MSNLTSKSAQYINAKNLLGDHRKDFDSLTDALDMLRKIYASEAFPADFPTVAAGVGLVDASGVDTIPPLDKWPAEYKTAGVSTCVSFIGVRGIKQGEKEVNGARGFSVYPLHPIDAIRADETGEAWLNKITTKEASHVALRGLRNVPEALGTDALAAAALQMPVTVADYVEESTRESLDSTAFDNLWKNFRKMLSESPDTAALVPQLPVKAEVIKSIRSSEYARREWTQLEEIGAFVFMAETMVGMIEYMRAEATKEGTEFEIDSAEIKAWIANRDKLVFPSPKKVDTDLSTLNFAAFVQKAIPTAAAAPIESPAAPAAE